MSIVKSATSFSVAKVNNTEILVIENGEKRIAVKPICEALGVSIQGQLEKLKNDPILSSVVKLSFTTGADGKQYEMQTIPFKYVFGWLFRIDSRNVKEEARATVEKYQAECYDVLYDHFNRQTEFLKARQSSIDAQIEMVDKLRSDFRDADKKLKEAKHELDRRRSITFQQWMLDKSQLSLFSMEEMDAAIQDSSAI